MESGGSMPFHKDSLIIHILSRINPIPRFDTYFFKVLSNIVSHIRLDLPKGLIILIIIIIIIIINCIYVQL